ncbi:MAG: class I SAM-dependent methyltransferase [Kiritimatiellae bacterium]|nr:class I SAM-dependent methyltransferase [Kiritimatiellia bacterium]
MQNDQARFFDQSDPYLTEKKDRRILRIREFVQAAWKELKAPGAALDIGCANGSILEQLPAGIRKAGIDVSTVLLEQAKAKGIETHCVNVDEAPLPFDDGAFDLVIATDVIEHVVHTDHLLNEVNRVLRSGGVFVAGIPNVNQPISFVMQFILDLTPMFAARYRCPHYRDFTARLMKLILEKHGFAVRRREGSYLFPFENSRLGIWLAKRIPRWGTQVFLAAEKHRDCRIEEGFQPDMPALLKWLQAMGKAAE